MSDLSLLLAARRQAFVNRTKTGGTHRVVLGAALVFGALLMALGYLTGPRLLAIPNEILTPRLGVPQNITGDTALEAAFWLTALLCSISSFRVMEMLFRREDVRVVSLLPIAAKALFWDRLLSGLGEALAFGLLLSMFFAPLALLGAPMVAFACMGVVVSGLVSTTVITMAVLLWMGGQYGGSSAMGDAYGGQGGAFIYAPGAALAGSVINLLLIQLSFSQVLAQGLTRAFGLGMGVAACVTLVALATARTWMGRSYHQAAAFFREAENVGHTIDTEFQISAMAQPHWLERLTGVNLIVRRYALQGGRKNALQRYVFGFFSAGLVFAVWRFSQAALPTWTIAALPAVFFVSVTPWERTRARDMGVRHAEYLGVSTRQERSAELVFLVGETVWVAWLVAAALLAFRGVDTTTSLAAAVAALTPTALLGAVSTLGAASNRAYRLVVAIAFTLVLGTLCAVSLAAAAAFVALSHLAFVRLKGAQGAIRMGEFR